MNGKYDTADLIQSSFKTSKTDIEMFYCRNAKFKSVRGRQQKGIKKEKIKGYTNLKIHLHSYIGAHYEKMYLDHISSALGKLDSQLFTSTCYYDAFKII